MGRQTLVNDAENRLVSFSGGGTTAGFVYDEDGNRVKATFNGTTTIYVGNYYEKTGSTWSTYYYANGQRVAVRRPGEGLYLLLDDHLDSTAMATFMDGGKRSEKR